ncbi:MAG: hypothetical protein CMP45_05975 [Rickettsiales bacterium]|nr:hypothetical protein [Rickettsiales bacterium]|tara:strand:- start:1500 stop:5243 length:3744 start_codon:yes stop_codon:yes gene_type:complete
MKTKSIQEPKSSNKHKSKNRDKESGIAIVTVLSVLMMMTLLVFGFFSAATEELKSSTYYGSSLKTRQLTDVVTNMVIAQVRKATGEQTSEGQRFTWVSQPGCITTFSNRGSDYDTLSVAKFKLYSSETMEENADDNMVDDIQEDWDKKPHHYVDLNAPLYSERENELYFPILDPRARRSTNDTNKDNVEGFNYTQTTSTGTQVPGVVLPGSDPLSQRVPMPVQWLYILEDGTMGHLDKSDTFVPGSGIGKASISNPIVARIAFWTDDECNKVNVNTASEGVHWDIPRYDSKQEREMAVKQPVQRETSRFPGHPSMVSLSSVLYPHEDVSQDKAKLRNIYDLVPKIEYKNSSASGSSSTKGVTWDTDRLYATYDELLYKHERNRGLDERQESNTFRNSQISRRKLEQSRFFLTANSIGPETTLFGTPKMTMWPTYTNTGRNTYFDNLINFISTIGTKNRKYYWQRNSSGSRHNEIYGNANGANLQLLDNYLINLIAPSNQIPGYGGSLGRKYGSGPYQDGKQILTMMWDYIRTTNLNDPYNNDQYTARGNASGHGQVAGCCLCGGTSPHQIRWDKPYLKFPRGFGRLPTLTEVSLVFKATGQRSEDGSAQGNSQGLPPGGVNVEVGLLLETFCPSHGFTKMVPKTSLQVVGGRFGNQNKEPASISINGVNIGKLVPNNKALCETSMSLKGFRGWGAHGGPRQHGTTQPVYWTPSGGNAGGGVPAGGGGLLRVKIEGGVDRQPASEPDMRVVLYDERNSQDVNNLIQVFELDFPNEFTIPMPRYDNRDSWKQTVSKARNNPQNLISPGTVVRSLVVSHSDFRLLGAKRVIENHVFQPHPKFNTNDRQAHSLVDPDGYKYTGFENEREFIVGADYTKTIEPDFPISPENPNFFVDVRGNPRTDYKFSVDPMITGDWDNGIAMQMDGPYVNRGDDGNRPSGNRNPYFDEKALTAADVTSQAFFSPNRVICGPGMYGSMSSGVQADIPWRTLLFRPDPEHFGAADQPNQGDPPDHLWMDLFWMPVVEPYAISMPAATRGKINLNTQIVPFDYIKRNTAMHALMKAERVVAIPTNAGGKYKEQNGGSDSWRSKIDAYETMKQWEDKFKENELFRSPTEICEMYLVPEGETLGTRSGKDYPKMRKFWESHRLTGDNTKERPYANMQPRLTTKSNVFKVHMIVQTLRKARSTDADKVDPEKDKPVGTWRGSALIERFIDPSDKKIPDYFNDPNMTNQSLEKFYNYRVLHIKQFAL